MGESHRIFTDWKNKQENADWTANYPTWPQLKRWCPVAHRCLGLKHCNKMKHYPAVSLAKSFAKAKYGTNAAYRTEKIPSLRLRERKCLFFVFQKTDIVRLTAVSFVQHIVAEY